MPISNPNPPFVRMGIPLLGVVFNAGQNIAPVDYTGGAGKVHYQDRGVFGVSAGWFLSTEEIAPSQAATNHEFDFEINLPSNYSVNSPFNLVAVARRQLTDLDDGSLLKITLWKMVLGAPSGLLVPTSVLIDGAFGIFEEYTFAVSAATISSAGGLEAGERLLVAADLSVKTGVGSNTMRLDLMRMTLEAV